MLLRSTLPQSPQASRLLLGAVTELSQEIIEAHNEQVPKKLTKTCWDNLERSRLTRLANDKPVPSVEEPRVSGAKTKTGPRTLQLLQATRAADAAKAALLGAQAVPLEQVLLQSEGDRARLSLELEASKAECDRQKALVAHEQAEVKRLASVTRAPTIAKLKESEAKVLGLERDIRIMQRTVQGAEEEAHRQKVEAVGLMLKLREAEGEGQRQKVAATGFRLKLREAERQNANLQQQLEEADTEFDEQSLRLEETGQALEASRWQSGALMQQLCAIDWNARALTAQNDLLTGKACAAVHQREKGERELREAKREIYALDAQCESLVWGAHTSSQMLQRGETELRGVIAAMRALSAHCQCLEEEVVALRQQAAASAEDN